MQNDKEEKVGHRSLATVLHPNEGGEEYAHENVLGHT